MNKKQLEFIFKKIDYHPSDEQWEIHLAQNRIRLVTGGERAGKSTVGGYDCFARSFGGKLYWIAAIDYERTRAEFNYIQDAHVKMGVNFDSTKRVDPGEITNELGVVFKTKSLKDPRTIAMEAPDGILVCEAAMIDYESYLRLRGRLAEKRAWMLMEGTLEASLGWYVDLYGLGKINNKEDLRSFALPTWSNLAIFPGGRNDPELKALEAQYPADWFLERFAGIPCPPKGLVFPEFKMNTHVIDDDRTTRDPKKPVFVWVDPGYQHAYSVLAVQNRGTHVAIIDEVYERGLVTEDIINECKRRPWWKYVPTVAGAIDIAAKQHQAMPSAMEVWQKKGGKHLRAQRIGIKDGIERMKMALKVNSETGFPQLLISPNCKGIISELGGCPNPIDGQTRVYRWRMDNNGQVIGDVPDDKNNDACKAACYGLVDMLGYAPRRQARPTQLKVR